MEEALGHAPDVLVLDMVELLPPEARADALKGLGKVVEMATASGEAEVFLQIDAESGAGGVEGGDFSGGERRGLAVAGVAGAGSHVRRGVGAA